MYALNLCYQSKGAFPIYLASSSQMVLIGISITLLLYVCTFKRHKTKLGKYRVIFLNYK